MDLKGVVKTLSPQIGVERKTPIERTIRSENTTEREGNGQASYGNGDQHREPMSDEQFQNAFEHIKAHSVVTENNLLLSVEGEPGKRFIVLSESNGKVVRRIPESELWTLQFAKDSDKGQLLSKSA